MAEADLHGSKASTKDVLSAVDGGLIDLVAHFTRGIENDVARVAASRTSAVATARWCACCPAGAAPVTAGGLALYFGLANRSSERTKSGPAAAATNWSVSRAVAAPEACTMAASARFAMRSGPTG